MTRQPAPERPHPGIFIIDVRVYLDIASRSAGCFRGSDRQLTLITADKDSSRGVVRYSISPIEGGGRSGKKTDEDSGQASVMNLVVERSDNVDRRHVGGKRNGFAYR